MPQVGTTQWNRATNGVLRRRDRIALAAQAIALQLRALGERQRSRLGLGSSALGSLDVDSLRLPDTTAAREAEALCAESSPQFLVAHCHRTYLWAHILGKRDRLEFDEEMLYVAALLHDLGLTDRFVRPDDSNRCFAHWAGEPARDLCSRSGWEPARCDAVVNAISLHLNSHVGLEHGTLAHLLGAGAGCDVAGIRASQIDHATRAAVVALHPRGDFKIEMAGLLRKHANEPGTRANFLLTTAQIEKRMLTARLPD